ncbi:flagellar biosynthetic protein FliU [Clostridium saccharobutylicum]|uniref:flagellin lysine-N-methylase n=1 Tax=Clostridium saccharobutylicum TaxID=169679 RepID=UPI000983E6AD|nr:flagellin lysine-N-methylase [Clostridium saccharobutylicum]AQS08928.1 flagellar biosynthetic protein FliU [Clostridium saccharobutylicum]MBC2438123.1 FliB family protein [Clostridium saccharobutylicum]NSB90641.1 lysine-N-methylase [Clostridium saccharobutylicum]NYC28724.1 lysine-N-methylase [Clostridium saccharobutylicum]OOM18899.1 flagellar biosynthetic protein FliU [Clostridium saccharobutylicum]
MEKNIKVRYPVYLKEFKCIGGCCEDTCCCNWEIYIDKSTFELYKNLNCEKIDEQINSNIFIRHKCNNVNIDYGQIKLNHDKYCPFLDKNKYCSIQSKFGEEYLSNVCANFPRIINKINDYYEMSLDISCIEAAKIVLLKKGGIDFDESQMEIGKHILMNDINTNDYIFEYTNTRYVKEIRDMSIKIIQNRRYELSERLYMLGSFLESTRKKLCYNYHEAYRFIGEYNIDSFNGEFKRDETNYMLQISFFKNMLDNLIDFKGYINEDFKFSIDKVVFGFRFNKNESIIENSGMYLNAYEICEKNYFQKYNYIFENFLVNHVFKELFPFSESDIMFDDYIMILVRFSYIRFYLVGNYLYSGELSKDDIVKLIQTLTKELEHDENYLKDILIYLKKHELYSNWFASVLL